LTAEDSVPFALRVIKADFTFLYVPQIKRFKQPQWDSLFAGPTVLIAPLEFPQAESLARLSNGITLVSTRRENRLPQALPQKVFFTFRDGSVSFLSKKGKSAVQTYLSKRKSVFTVQ
jgi:hypothetical protein